MKIFRTTITDEIPPFGRNDSPVSGLRGVGSGGFAATPYSLSQKGDSHSDQREESPAHISHFTERHKQ
ncbi:hypothetical protein [Viscerimonas tarda]